MVKLFKRGKFNTVNDIFIGCAIQIPKLKNENNMNKNFTIYSNKYQSLSLSLPLHVKLFSLEEFPEV